MVKIKLLQLVSTGRFCKESVRGRDTEDGDYSPLSAIIFMRKSKLNSLQFQVTLILVKLMPFSFLISYSLMIEAILYLLKFPSHNS